MATSDSTPKVTCNLRLEFSSGDEARKINKAIELDNMGYIDTRVEGSSILAEI